MATHNADIVDIDAGEAIARGQFVKLVAGVLNACDTEGEKADGIAFSDASSGEACGVQVGKKVKVKVGAVAVAKGARLTTDANGLALTAAAGDYVRAKALEAGAAGAYITALWTDDVGDGT